MTQPTTPSAPIPPRPCSEFPNDNEDLHDGAVWVCGWTRAMPRAVVRAKAAGRLAHGSPSDVACPAAPSVSPPGPAPVAPSHESPEQDAPDVYVAVAEASALEVDALYAQPPEATELQSDTPTDPFLEELAALVRPLGAAESMAELAPLDIELFDELTPKLVKANPKSLEQASQRVQPLVALQFELTPLPPELSRWMELTSRLSDYLLGSGHTRAAALLTPLLNAEQVDLSRLEPGAIERLIRDEVACRRGLRVVTTPSFRDSVSLFREEFTSQGLNAGDALFWLAQLLVALSGTDLEPEQLEDTLRQLGVAALFERAA